MKKIILIITLLLSGAFALDSNTTAGTPAPSKLSPYETRNYFVIDMAKIEKSQETLKNALSFSVVSTVDTKNVLSLAYKKRLMEELINGYIAFFNQKIYLIKNMALSKDKIDETIAAAKMETFNLYWEAFLENYKNLSGETAPYDCTVLRKIDACENDVFLMNSSLFSDDEKSIRATYRAKKARLREIAGEIKTLNKEAEALRKEGRK